MNARRWFVPSVSTMIWILLFAGIVLSDWRVVLVNADGDPSLHRRIGDWMIEHRQILRQDEFSHTRPGAPLISKEWLSEVVFAAAGRVAGWNGIVWLSALLIATTFWWLHRQLLAEGADVLVATGVVLLAAWASATHWLARPHLATHLLTLVFAWQLRQFDRGAVSGKRLWLTLVPGMLLWVNLHGAFLAGFILA